MASPQPRAYIRPMRLARPLAAILSLCLLAACATTQRLAAASDVHALLVSIRDNDADTFEAHVDRRALERQLQTRLEGQAERIGGGNSDWSAVTSLLAGPLSRVAGDALIRPEVFRAVAESYGYGPQKPIPNAFQVASILRSLPDGQVCAPRKKNGPCLLTFAEEGGTWRLVSFDGDTAMLRRKGG
jgi:hypothetical protein